ncbi:MAG: serine/threonine-protein kinase [Myxococcota bacterium]
MSLDTDGDPNHTIYVAARPAIALSVAKGLGPATEVLGVGGMGVVRAALQHSLHREVAVKSIKAEFAHTRASDQLLHEAFVAGLLDHPNVLPVHDIVVDDEGQPHIVMKRVAGEAWSAWAFDEQRVRETFGVSDLLAWNLGVFMQVCNAIAYAHDQGILHRDVKLGNVMIGSFGEVLVLDWGIAVALDARHGGRLPLAQEQTQLAGTPSMMAPEMARCDGPALGPRTDVYLLGAVLHHIVVGKRPHLGKSAKGLVAKIPTSEIRLPDAIARELASIIERAMCNAPSGRHKSVLALKADIQRFLDRRGSLRATRAALSKVEQLNVEVSSEQADRRDVYRHFERARFGLEYALAEWPDNGLAKAGLDDARTIVARWELREGRTEAAAALVESMGSPPADVVDAVQKERAGQSERDEELRKLVTYRDPKLGRRTRVAMVGILGLAWVFGPVLFRGTFPVMGWAQMVTGSLTMLGLVLLVGYVARRRLAQTRLNRASWIATLAAPIAQLVFDASAMALNMNPGSILTLRPALLFVVVLMYTLTSLRRAWPAPILYAAAAVASGLWPEWSTLALTIASVGFLVVLARLWWYQEFVEPTA